MLPMTISAVNDRMWRSSRNAAPVQPPAPQPAAQAPPNPQTGGNVRVAEGEKGVPVDPTHKLQKLLDEQSVPSKTKEP